ncbi:hypothetical protein DM01DRAFT_1328094 [Hesseltinella vesiculosa]|uniref:Helicase ATP-binding domain-containing protein n=1 Tax=Hesseltinella vesiculosa TaxID=101127 RepID=A0A1X2G6B9_9FUNG|nr:hypothetical protein DM01DRAFT_1328094 [Hesseltinella vesiculosa]
MAIDVVSGSTLFTEALKEWKPDSEHHRHRNKRTKRDGTDLITAGQLRLPIDTTIPAVLANTLHQIPLTVHCTSELNGDDYEYACLCLSTPANRPIVQAEVVFSEPNTPAKDRSWTRFFIALIKASQSNIITISRCPDTSPSNTQPLALTLDVTFSLSNRKAVTFFFTTLLPHWHPLPSFDQPISIDAFYRHLQPPVMAARITKCNPPQLLATLTPFQSQNVEWMLQREGYNILDCGTLERRQPCTDLPFMWERMDNGLCVNRLTRQACLDSDQLIQNFQQRAYHGGILADEMGLGKTVSVIALILLNAAKKSSMFSKLSFPGYKTAHSTLVITPSSIIHQWESEIKIHAPSLSVAMYDGIHSLPKDTDVEQFGDSLADHDIVLTTYDVLRNEVHYARPTSDRSLRHDSRHRTRKSPLMLYVWWRCILDEAQRVESPVSVTSEMACLIPRIYSWGVTGTPMKSSNFSDLYGLYQFTDYLGDIRASHFRQLFTDPKFQAQFWSFTKATMRRNLKIFLQDQIHIPPQHRYVIHIPFSAIEQHYYNDMWTSCTSDVDIPWLDSIDWKPPSPTSSPSHFPDTLARLRRWLTSLRESCVHATVSAGKTRQEEVRSLDQAVLEIMTQSTEESIEEIEHQMASNLLQQGGMNEVLKNWTQSLVLYRQGSTKVKEHLQSLADKTNQLSSEQLHSDTSSSDNNDAKNNRLGKLLLSQHGWQLLLHRFYFYTAGIYLMMEDHDNEEKLYDMAADLRRQILSRPAKG